MRAIVHQGQGIEGIRVAEIATSDPGPDEVVIKVKVAALNHRDLWTCWGRRPDEPPIVLGSDAAGTAMAVGKSVSDLSPLREVVIIASLHWTERRQVPPPNFEI